MSAKKQPKPSNLKEYKQGVLKGLTFRQRRFAEYYVICGNKTEAAVKAGYAPKNASWVGSTLTNNDKVSRYIEYLLADQNDEIMASIEEAKRRMSLALRGKLKEEVVVMEYREDIEYDEKGRRTHSVKTTSPIKVKKELSARDQIEASKHYIDLLKVETKHVEMEESQDDKLIKALNNRAESIGASVEQPAAEIVFETSEKKQPEGNDDGDEQ